MQFLNKQEDANFQLYWEAGYPVGSVYTSMSDNVVDGPYKVYVELFLILGATNSPGIHMQSLAARKIQHVVLRIGGDT